jgi:hypothetical protein
MYPEESGVRVHYAVPGIRPGARLVIPQSCGGHSEGETPGPIPNPEVKPLSADGTAREASRESRTPPHISSKEGRSPQGSAFFALFPHLNPHTSSPHLIHPYQHPAPHPTAPCPKSRSNTQGRRRTRTSAGAARANFRRRSFGRPAESFPEPPRPPLSEVARSRASRLRSAGRSAARAPQPTRQHLPPQPPHTGTGPIPATRRSSPLSRPIAMIVDRFVHHRVQNDPR